MNCTSLKQTLQELNHISPITEQSDQNTRFETMQAEFSKQVLDKSTRESFAMSAMIIGVISQVDKEKTKVRQQLVSLVALMAQQNKQLNGKKKMILI